MRMNKFLSIRNWVMSLIMVASIGGAMTSMVLPQMTSAATKCTSDFLGFPAWYKGVINESTCDVVSPDGPAGSKDHNTLLCLTLYGILV